MVSQETLGSLAQHYQRLQSWAILCSQTLDKANCRQVTSSGSPKSDSRVPKPVLVPTSFRPTTLLPLATPSQGPSVPLVLSVHKTPSERVELINHFWSMILNMFQLLNASKTQITILCWLWYNARPYFYECIGLIAKIMFLKGNLCI